MSLRARWHLLALPLAALAVTIPLILHGNSCGHDFDFHIDSWIEVAQQWRQGIAWPHWDASANFGAGEPRFVFYPPLSWMMGALLGMIFGWNLAAGAFVFIALLAAAVSMYWLAREYADSRSAVVAAVLFAANPYMLFVVYERAAYAELLAAAWMPLVILYALRRRIRIGPLAVAVALCWLTNGPAGVMATYVVALLLLFRVAERDWRNTLRGATALAFGIALSAFYLLPAAVERRWIEIESAVTGDVRPEASFLFGRIGALEHIVVLHTVSWIAVILFVTAAVAYTFVMKRRDAARRLAAPLLLLGVLLLLMLPLSAIAWRHAPELVFVQFPWRFLIVVSVLVALAVAVALSRAGAYAWLGLLLVPLIVGVAYPRFQQACDEEDVVSAQAAALQSGPGVAGGDEYAIKGADISGLAQGMPHAWLAEDADANPPAKEDVARISVREWSAQARRLVVRSDSDEYLIVRLTDFPAWHLLLDGHVAGSIGTAQRDDGLVVVPVAAGISRLEFVYREPRDALVGRLVSLCALLMLLVLGMLRRRARHVGNAV